MKNNATSSDRYVFISYKSEEKELADRIKSFLEQHGFKWWMAPDSLNQVGTQDYSNDIYRAIRGCSCLIFAVSSSSLSSKWVNREVRYALDKCEKPIIPFVVVPVPERVQEENSLYITMMLEKQILNGDGSWDMEKVLMPYLNRVFGQGGQVDREVEDFDNRADAVSASTAAAEVQSNVLAKCLSVEDRVKEALGPYWQEFRIIHGVQIRDADGRLVPLAELVASNRGVFVGVSIESLPSNIRNPLPSENPAWPFAVAVAERCGLSTESPPLFGALVVPDDYPSPNGGFPFWVIREQDVASKMLSLDPCPDCEKNRQNLIRRLETLLPMSSVGAEANALMHFTAPIPEWEDGAALLPKVDRPSPRLLAFAQRAAVELKRVGNGAADAVFSWLDKFAGTTMPVTVAGMTKTIALPGGAEMELIWCPPGEFMMGSPGNEEGRGRYETQHRVQLKKGFWLGRYPVTQRQWRAVMGNNPSYFKGDDLPVERVSWNDCQGFIKKVNAAFQCGARLPTEAEWEYACRAGTATVYSWGNALNGDKANCIGITPYGTRKKGPYLKKTTPVGKYGANPWGLSDMHGNVYEWCTDWYGPYPAGHVVDPLGSALGNGRVLRGGSWDSYAKDCRSAHRAERRPGFLHKYYGFRLCCSAMPVQ